MLSFGCHHNLETCMKKFLYVPLFADIIDFKVHLVCQKDAFKKDDDQIVKCLQNSHFQISKSEKVVSKK